SAGSKSQEFSSSDASAGAGGADEGSAGVPATSASASASAAARFSAVWLEVSSNVALTGLGSSNTPDSATGSETGASGGSLDEGSTGAAGSGGNGFGVVSKIDAASDAASDAPAS